MTTSVYPNDFFDMHSDSIVIEPHPRLLIKDSEITELRVAVQESAVLKKMHDYVIEQSNNMLYQNPVVYQKEGKRLLAISRLALTRIFYLSYSYRMTNDQAYLQRAEQELLAVSAFKDWNPSHFLDVGEMSMGVAIGYDWLYNDLGEESREKIRTAIIEKAIIPADNPEYAWFYERSNNWNQVCNAGLVMGALAVIEDTPVKAQKVVQKAVETNVLALEKYGPHGNYPEGPGYWNYGTIFQVMMFSGMESVYGTDFGLSEYEGFMESAEYMLYSTGPSGLAFNYSDAISKPYPAYAMFWFANKSNNPDLIFQEINLIKNGEYFKYRHGNDDRLLPAAIVFSKGLKLSAEINNQNSGYWMGAGVTPVFFMRSSWEDKEAKYFAIKGGEASTSHGHMDQGTFVYDIGPVRWAMDLGSQRYESLEESGVDLWDMDQDSNRWEIFRLNNLNHNTISINNQPHNVNGKASIIDSYENEHSVGVKLDMTKVLNLNNELENATRKIKLINETVLELEDIVETGDEGVWLRWNMVTPAEVTKLDDYTIALRQKGKEVKLEFQSSVPIELEIRESEDPTEVINYFTGTNYEFFNQLNPGTQMLGFNAFIPRETEARFRVHIK